MIRNSTIKIISLIVIISLNWTGLSAVVRTFAYFDDTETSTGNTFQAGTLVLSLHSGQDNFVPTSKAENMKPGDELTRVIQVRNEGILLFQYTARTEKISGDDDLCSALWLEAKLEGQEKVKYEGSLMSFNFPVIEMTDSLGIDTWHFKASLPEGTNFQNKTCQINFVFEGWQTEFPDSSLGFFDREEIESYFATGSSGLTNEESLNNEDNQEEINSSQSLIDEEPTENFSESELEEAGQEPVVEETPALEIPTTNNSTDSAENSQGDNQAPADDQVPAVIPENDQTINNINNNTETENSSNIDAGSSIGDGGENTITGETSGSSDGLNSGEGSE